MSIYRYNKHTFNEKLKNNNILNYILVDEYPKNNKIKVVFYCTIHNHHFLARPNDILSGVKSCEYCQIDIGHIQKYTKCLFNLQLNKLNIPYYLIDEYPKNNKIDVLFSCNMGHPNFLANPKEILSKKKSCPCCSNRVPIHDINTINKKLITNNIDYICTEYNGYSEESSFYCKLHNWNFTATPARVLTNHTKCPICSGHTYWDITLFNNFLLENNKNIICSYFVSTNDNSMCTCLICNYTWEPTPKNIIYGKCGCPNCCRYGFDPMKPAIYYYVELLGYNLYKGGITNYNIKKRHPQDYKIMKTVFIKNFEYGKDAYQYEQNILKEFKQYRYNGEPILKSGGNTEIFITDIFNLN